VEATERIVRATYKTGAMERVLGATDRIAEALEGTLRATDTPTPQLPHYMRNLYQTNKRKNNQSISRDKMK